MLLPTYSFHANNKHFNTMMQYAVPLCPQHQRNCRQRFRWKPEVPAVKPPLMPEALMQLARAMHNGIFKKCCWV